MKRKKRLTYGELYDLLEADRLSWTEGQTLVFGEWRHQCVYVDRTTCGALGKFNALFPAFSPLHMESIGLVIDATENDTVP